MNRTIVYSLIACAPLLSCNQQAPLFTSLAPEQTHVTFTNTPEQHHLFNILYYLYYYNGGGVATGDINNDGLTDIYFTANNRGGNKLYLNKGGFVFEDITAAAGVAGTADWCSGVSMTDVNSDGFLDIYVSAVAGKYGLKGHNELFINNKNGTFTESSANYGLNFSGYTTQTAFFDYDHDGDLDCYILNQSHQPHANIVDTAYRRRYDSISGDRLYRNEIVPATAATTGTARFTDVSKQAGIFQSNLGYGLGIGIADMNNDGWEDIYIGNDFHENDYYYLNQGDGTFIESGAQHFKHYSRFSMGNDIADYNNDAQPDVVTVDMLPPDEKIVKTYGSDENPDIYKVKLEINGYQYQYSKNCLQRNNGNGASFSELSLQSGMSATDWSWSPLFADFDNDGNKDLFISSGIVKRPVDLDYIRFVSGLKNKGMDQTDKYDDDAINAMPDGASHPFLFRGDGKLYFSDMSNAWGTASLKGYFTGAAYADLDNDGNLDLVVNCINAPALILKNTAPKKSYISVSFRGDSSNTYGVGAKTYLFTSKGLQYQQLMLTRGFQSSSDARLLFGLDSLSVIDSMLVVWPDQQYQVLKQVTVNQALTIDKKNAAGVFVYDAYFPAQQPPLQDITASIPCNWKHRENDFVDFNVQYLIPHEQSIRGPKLAVADVNKDGLDDFYACGAKLQPGALMIQQPNGAFAAADTALFNRFAPWEDVDATFFDANNDGFPDLYVVSGGNEYNDGNSMLGDRLFINDGKGHFTYATGALPGIFTNKSCVAVADADKDGDNDLFVGGLAASRTYGYLQPSYLLLNNGTGKFTNATNAVIQLDSPGMVTSASFTDVNNDSWPDLVVAGEWMAVKVFINGKGKFTAADIKGSTGLWQTVYTTDVNKDGFADILAGNWGHNTKLWAGRNGPVKLYVRDFDGNGSVEQVMCYTMNGQEYTFLAKDELERSLPVLKKAYLAYSEVAGKTVQYMFYDLFKNYKEYTAETLSSSFFINDGKGNFKQVRLPDDMQLAPVFAFARVPFQQKDAVMATGNFYGVVPYEGRYDALLPSISTYNNSAGSFDKPVSLPAIDGEVRDAEWISTATGKVLAVARNNKGIVFLKPVAE